MIDVLLCYMSPHIPDIALSIHRTNIFEGSIQMHSFCSVHVLIELVIDGCFQSTLFAHKLLLKAQDRETVA